jgi:hypothetical protein
MRLKLGLLLSICLLSSIPVVGQSLPEEGVGEPPVPFMAELRAERAARPLRAGTLGALPRAITPPGYYDLSVAGDMDLGGAIFRNGYPFIHQDIGVYNTAVGTEALINLTTGYYNVAFGYRALRYNESGYGNMAAGGVALEKNTTGSGNTAVGDMTLRENVSGNSNTAIGQYALVANTTGSSNTAIGASAMLYTAGASSGNTAVGVEALRYNTNGAGLQTAIGYRAARNNFNQENTAIGANALFMNSTGQNNTAIGSYTLYFSISGDDNIALGRRAGYNLQASSNSNIMIGNEGPSAIESNTIRIGAELSQNRAFLAGVRGVTTDNADAVAVMVDSLGQLGTVSSSRRFKEDIRDMGRSSQALLDLRPVTFRYKREFDDAGKPVQFGLVAEEVAESFPELVVYDGQGRPETVKYHLLSVLLLNELQRQEVALREERSSNAERDRRLAELESLIAELRN